MKYTILGVLVMLLFLSGSAQINSGVNFVQDLSWEQVKERAKAERKYIFIDCYTTWCGPCKKMDTEVFTNDSLGKFMDANFICLKVQMDKSQNDDGRVKTWYPYAESINREYRVNSYPAYLFFSPDGQIVHRAGSYMLSDEFISMAKKSLNPREQYYSLLDAYKKGNKDYVIIPYLISMAQKLNNKALLAELKSDYLNYIGTLKNNELYSKDILEFLGQNVQSTESKYFKIFYTNEKRVNHVIGEACFARRITDSIIAREYLNAAVDNRKKNEPNWDSLYSIIKGKFNSDFAKRNILWKKVRWYDEKKDSKLLVKNFCELIKENGLDTCRVGYGDAWINAISYIYIFGNTPFAKGSDDITEINSAIVWMKDVVRRAQKTVPGWQTTTIDTYAMLLYKASRKSEAIDWEERALAIAKEHNSVQEMKSFKGKLEKMKNNESTWK